MKQVYTYLQMMLVGSLILVFASCEQEDQADLAPDSGNAASMISATSTQSAKRGSTSYTTYVIREGQHSTYSPYKSLRTNTLVFEAVFDNSAVYTSVDPVNQLDINKLYGMADCGTSHQVNSARFGWRWYENSLQIFAYVYSDGMRYSQYITTVELNMPYKYELQLYGSSYIFTVNGTKVTLPRGCSGKGIGYQLYPYFGGDEVAPHDITIRIKNL